MSDPHADVWAIMHVYKQAKIEAASVGDGCIALRIGNDATVYLYDGAEQNLLRELQALAPRPEGS